MPEHPDLNRLSRRERQIMEIVHRQGAVSAGEVRSALDHPPSYSAVRAHLRILEEKGWLQHKRVGPRYVYRPVQSTASASRTALRGVVKTFFGCSLAQAVAALVNEERSRLTEDELRRIESIIREAKKEKSYGNHPS